MRTIQKGFTLIELIVVIVILGILAATALPKFVDLGDDAAQAAVQGVAGAMTSAASINYGAHSVNSAKGLQLSDTRAKICSTTAGDVGATAWGTGVSSILQGGLPAGYTLGESTTSAAACATTGFVHCLVTGQKSQTATAMVACVS